MIDSQQLLARFVQNSSEDAFRELVCRYIDLVYSTALRLVGGDTHQAQDLAQTVFLDLARKAPILPGDIQLGGWLHHHTCFVAGKFLRGERRRQSRERLAVEMNALNDHSSADFPRIAPVLDEAIDELEDGDRKAVLLRFYEQRDFRSVGEAIGTTEDAARMRVNRALEKLETLLKRRGVTTTAAALSPVLIASAVQSAPVGLAATISVGALAGTAITTSAVVVTTAKTIAMTTLQKTLVTVAVAALASAGIYEARQTSQLREQNQILQQKQAPLAAQIRQLQLERDALADRQSALADEIAKLKGNPSELLQLRAEVTRLRADSRELAQVKAAGTNDPAQVELASWLASVKRLKQEVEKNPQARVPEFSLLTEQDWLNSARLFGKRTQFDAATDLRVTLAELRQTAQNSFANLAQQALVRYGKDHNGAFPPDLSQFQSYIPTAIDGQPVDYTILQRYTIAPAEKFGMKAPGQDWVITQKELVDDEYDHHIAIGMNNWSYARSLAQVLTPDELTLKEVLDPGAKEFSAANNGQEPTDPSQLLPYLTTDEQKLAVQKIMALRNSSAQTNQ